MDKLEEMFKMQHNLNVRTLGPKADQVFRENPIEWIPKLSQALQQEVSELIDCVPWKWWAHYQKEDLEHAKVELIDIVHFVICLAQTLGLSADDIFNIYKKKNAANIQRQEAGYTQKSQDISPND